ncbi:MAG TPA: DUF3576 domain-containing protein [Alphaproteobacteria bacterium]|nr:DUF3576 domain-containing protein [Alphaproteobacteria bacterium]
MKNKTLMLFAIALVITSFTSSCSSDESSDKPQVDQSFPLGNKYKRRKERGSLLQAGSWIFGDAGRESDKIGAGGGGGVNAYLWRATLDIMSFMPLQSADAVGGVVITDWYEDPQAKGERIKANILISTSELRADALKVKLFRQKNGKDVPRNPELERKLEDKILTRARELKIEGNRL